MVTDLEIDGVSSLLFGRFASLRVFAAIAELPKPEFRTGQIVASSGAKSDEVSRELARLAGPSLRLVVKVGRQGSYRRTDSSFWALVLGFLDELRPD